MTNRSESKPPPTASARAAASLRALRQAADLSHAELADILTALGMPTKVATVARIERGSQAITVDQLVALATVFAYEGGVRSLLGQPIAVGELVVDDAAALDVLLLGDGLDSGRRRSAASREADEVSSRIIIETRSRQVAEHIGRPVEDVDAAARRIYQGRTAGQQVSYSIGRAIEIAEDEVGPYENADERAKSLRAFKTNAIRTVGTAIRHELDGTKPAGPGRIIQRKPRNEDEA